MTVQASAPGKVILFGEHAVVYGKHAIAGALGLRANVTLSPARESSLEIADLEIDSPIAQDANPGSLHCFFKAGIDLLDLPPVRIVVDSDVPIGGGLGSSAAMACAFLKAAGALKKIELGPQELWKKAQEMEKVFHGTPSGIDAAVSAHGGMIEFCAGKISRFECPEVPLLIGDTGVSKNTKQNVSRVRILYDSDRQKTEAILDEIDRISLAGKQALVRNDLKALGKLMGRNHALLKKLGVSSSELDDLVSAAVKAGALGAKMTGGGGGGCMIAVAQELDAVSKAIEDAGGKVLETKFALAGARVDSKY